MPSFRGTCLFLVIPRAYSLVPVPLAFRIKNHSFSVSSSTCFTRVSTSSRSGLNVAAFSAILPAHLLFPSFRIRYRSFSVISPPMSSAQAPGTGRNATPSADGRYAQRGVIRQRRHVRVARQVNSGSGKVQTSLLRWGGGGSVNAGDPHEGAGREEEREMEGDR